MLSITVYRTNHNIINWIHVYFLISFLCRDCVRFLNATNHLRYLSSVSLQRLHRFRETLQEECTHILYFLSWENILSWTFLSSLNGIVVRRSSVLACGRSYTFKWKLLQVCPSMNNMLYWKKIWFWWWKISHFLEKRGYIGYKYWS